MCSAVAEQRVISQENYENVIENFDRAGLGFVNRGVCVRPPGPRDGPTDRGRISLIAGRAPGPCGAGMDKQLSYNTRLICDFDQHSIFIVYIDQESPPPVRVGGDVYRGPCLHCASLESINLPRFSSLNINVTMTIMKWFMIIVN